MKKRNYSHLSLTPLFQKDHWCLFMRFHIYSSVSPEQLRCVGPLVRGSWINPSDSSRDKKIEGLFIIDTGANGILIDDDVANALKIKSDGVQNVHGVGGNHSANRYTAKLLLPAIDNKGVQVMFGIPINCYGSVGLTAKHKESGVNVIGLLGRLFLQFVRLNINGINGKISLDIDESIMFRRS